MNIDRLVSAASRLFFVTAFVLLALAVLEKIANTAGYTILQMYTGGRLLDYAVILLIFVIAMQLRAMREELKKRT
jgi:uncharacterized membrane protein